MRHPRSMLIALPLALGLLSAARGTVADELNPLALVPDHATASVADLDRECAWYERILGFRELGRNQSPDFEVRHLGIPGYRIDLAWQKGSSRPAQPPGPPYQGWLHVVFRTAALEGAYQRLQALGTDVRADKGAQGAVFRRPPRPRGQRNRDRPDAGAATLRPADVHGELISVGPFSIALARPIDAIVRAGAVVHQPGRTRNPATGGSLSVSPARPPGGEGDASDCGSPTPARPRLSCSRC